MPRRYLTEDVFESALSRLHEAYEMGRVIVSISGGKDSTVCMELACIAAKETGNLPVEVMMRDDEIMVPGTFEYLERVTQRSDIKFNWIVARQPVVNMFNRHNPYFWAFDSLLPPEQWVRRFPDFATEIPEKHIQGIVHKDRFPVDEGKELISVIGLRTQESRTRNMAVYSSKGHFTKPDEYGTVLVRPIYDWSDGDIWKSIDDNHWDYNRAYDVLARFGFKRNKLRIAPPTQSINGAEELQAFAKASPKWFNKVCERLPGVRAIALYGRRALLPYRRLGETWEQVFQRECIDKAPAWIAGRSIKVQKKFLNDHKRHSDQPFPDISTCSRCFSFGSWHQLANAMYTGNPFGLKLTFLKPIEPEFFRSGAGTWGGGKPTW